jgi:hypothetical protein
MKAIALQYPSLKAGASITTHATAFRLWSPNHELMSAGPSHCPSLKAAASGRFVAAAYKPECDTTVYAR